MSDSTYPEPTARPRRGAPALHRLVADEPLSPEQEASLRQHVRECPCCLWPEEFDEDRNGSETARDELQELREGRRDDLDELWSEFLEGKLHRELSREVDEAFYALCRSEPQDQPRARALLERRATHLSRWLESGSPNRDSDGEPAEIQRH